MLFFLKSGEVSSFGVKTRRVEAGFFRTELLGPGSTRWVALSIDDRAENSKSTSAAWRDINGSQGSDPAKLADALVELGGLDEPPARFVAGSDALAAAEAKANTSRNQVRAHAASSASLAHATA